MSSRIAFRSLWPGLMLLLLMGVAYGPLFGGGFLSWDDEANIVSNPYFANGALGGLWQTAYYGMFIPVTSTIWYVLFQLGGAEPFRVFNFVIHTLNTLLIFLLLRHFFKHAGSINAKAAAVLGASVFALHPVQAGTVGWISGGRDLLCLFFSLLAVHVYVSRFRLAREALALSLFVLAVLSKPQAAILPAVLLCAPLLMGRPWRREHVLRLIPWFGISAATVAVTLRAQGFVIEDQTPLWARPLVMLDAYGFYLTKLVWPYPLSADYGRRPEWVAQLPLSAVLFIAAALLVAAVLLRAKGPWRLGWIWFLVLLPTSGLLPFGFQYISTVADHYNYPAMVIAAGLTAFTVERYKPAVGIVTLLVLVWTGLTFQRAQVWADERTFFEDVLTKNPDSYMALVALGTFDCIRGQKQQEGLERLQRALKVRPYDPVATADVANCLYRLSRHADVLALESQLGQGLLRERLKVNDKAAAALFVPLGAAHLSAGNADIALEYFCQAVWRDPFEAGFQQNVIAVKALLQSQGRPSECPPRADLDAFLNRRLGL